jgi:hypothetical protein
MLAHATELLSISRDDFVAAPQAGLTPTDIARRQVS